MAHQEGRTAANPPSYAGDTLVLVLGVVNSATTKRASPCQLTTLHVFSCRIACPQKTLSVCGGTSNFYRRRSAIIQRR